MLRIISSKITSQSATFYHGTLRELLPQIMREGIEEGEGWGGANTKGVFLSDSPEGALYWAKLAYLRQQETGLGLEPERFDRHFGHQQDKLLAIVKVTIPVTQFNNLRADIEQSEDYGFEGQEKDWEMSIQQIGDARYVGPIPPQWLSIFKG